MLTAHIQIRKLYACALRWLEAYKLGKAPPIDLEATKIQALNFIDKKILNMYRLKRDKILI